MSEVVDVLRANQVEFEYSESGDTILVPEDKRAAMRMELAMKGLPKSGDVGFEIFDEGNFGISDFVQRTNHTRALQGELQRTIAMMDSVKSAKVFIVKPENNLLLSEDPNDRPSASVYVDLEVIHLIEIMSMPYNLLFPVLIRGLVNLVLQLITKAICFLNKVIQVVLLELLAK